MKSIEITFNPDGTSKVEAQGFKGGSCQQATKEFIEALGSVTSDKKKAEFYQQEVKSGGIQLKQ